jgi:predicted CoA-binding protein
VSKTDLRALLERARTIAVVGLSGDPRKAAHAIPRQLQAAGYRVIPVNPNLDEVLGERSYASLAEVPDHVDIVDVFRPAKQAPAIARQAAEIGAGAVWLQLGIESDEARRIAEAAGLDYVEDRCIGVERSRYGIRLDAA